LPTDPNYWLNPAIARLAVESNQTAQKSLLLLLWYAQTNEADAAIKRFSDDSTKPAEGRSYARALLDRKKSVGAPDETTEASLRQKRRERLKAVSDEALYDLDEYTMQLLSKRQTP
jgi:ActR/RegA family two-component response regulator